MSTVADRLIIETPEGQRDLDWCKMVANALLDNTSRLHRTEQIADARKMYRRGEYSESYEHLYGTVQKKVEDECGVEKTVHLVPPAKVRHIPIIKNMIRILVSDYRERPKIFRAYTTDSVSLDRKEERFIHELNTRQEAKVIQRLEAYKLQQQIMQMMAQAQQQEMTDQNRMAIMQMQSEMNRMNSILQRSVELEERELEALVRYFRYTYRDIQEIFAETSVRFQIADQRLEHTFSRAFEEKLVTGHQQFFVDWVPGMLDPTCEQVYYEQTYFPYNEHVQFLHEHSWGIREAKMSLDNIIARYNVTKKQLEQIKNDRWSHNNGHDGNYHDLDGKVFNQFVTIGNSRAHASLATDEYTVRSVYWKAHVPITVLKSPNRYGEDRAPFIKRLYEDEVEYWRERPEKLKEKGKSIKTYYRQDLYFAVRVGEHTFLQAGKHPVQLRSETKLSQVSLPFIGFADNYYYSNESLILETKDIQELYNILHYQRELLIVLSGVKGLIVDMSQMPEGVTLQEAILYMKQGILPIETLDEAGRAKNNSFNQFGTYDHTLSPAIGLIDASLASLLQLAGLITGVTDVRQGLTKPTDQVGTSQLAYNQSNLSTEKYFQDAETLFELVTSRMANLSKLAYKENGRRGAYVNGEKIMERVNIPAGAMQGEYRIVMQSGRKEADALRRVHEVSQNLFAKGQMQGSQFLELVSVQSIAEAKNLMVQYEKLAMDMAQAAEQRQLQGNQEIEERKAQLQLQLEKLNSQTNIQIQSMKDAIENKKIQLEAAKMQLDNEVKQELGNTKAATDKYKTDVEAGVEMAYLELQKQETVLNDENQKTAMLLDTVAKQMELDQRKKEKVKDS